jgi:hypothetical protein
MSTTPTYNVYAAMFKKWKDIFQKDGRTSNYQVYGAEHSKKKTFPCILIFPEEKDVIVQSNQRDQRKYGGPIHVEYTFNIWGYNMMSQIEDSYYNESNDANAGITQVASDIEAVIKSNKTGTDLYDSSIILWYDLKLGTPKFNSKPMKLMFCNLVLKLIKTELE